MPALRLAALAAFLVSFLPAQTVGFTDPSKLDFLITAALKESGAPSVSVSVVREGKVVYAKAFGMADIEKGRPANASTRYAVGSISKEFTAAALLMLAGEGKLSLDDTVAKYFPELTNAAGITLRQLLSHTSGYEDYAPQDYIIPEWTQPTTPQAILDRWAKKPLNFDPGTRWQYSNTNYVLAGEIFEKVSGQHLVDYLRSKFFQSLGMTTASDCGEASPADATAYTRYALGPPRVAAREAPGWYFAAGELCMTAADLSRWDIAFLARKVLPESAHQEFIREYRLHDGGTTHYALGLQLGELSGLPVIFHGGEVSGFLALNQIYPTQNVAVTVLSNEDGINLISPLARKIALSIMRSPESASEQPAPEEIAQIRTILQGLQNGRIDRAQFSANANSYFSEIALGDIRSSLQPLGTLTAVTRQNQSLRGGMTHRTYKAEFAKESLALNVYVMPDGKIEQLLVEQTLK